MRMQTLFIATTVALVFGNFPNGFCRSAEEARYVINHLEQAQSLERLGTIVQANTEPLHGEQPRVQTTSGLIYGCKNQYANSFFSIPYAEPPINSLRFKPSVKLDTPSVPRNLSENIHTECVQKGSFKEDCLVLSVHVPTVVDLSYKRSTSLTGFPVLFFIHGGSFEMGAGTSEMYDGRYLSRATSAIVVTINYRLGPLGFLVLNDGRNVIDGNLGLGDQRLAMEWVRENIENFGGDKNQVTIFGESAGAQSTMFHLLSKFSKPLYQHAIMESIPAAYWYPDRSQALEITKEFLVKLRCNRKRWVNCCRRWKTEYDCLMKASPKSLLAAVKRLKTSYKTRLDVLSAVEPFRPFIDGKEFMDQPMKLFKEGKWNTEKPFIIGTNKEELVIFENLKIIKSKPAYKIVNSLLFKGLGNGKNIGNLVSEKYIALYGSTISDYRHIFGLQMTDIIFGCTTRALARFASDTTKSNVYYYIFDHPLDGAGCQKVLKNLCGHSFHGAELLFVFRTKNHVGIATDHADKMVTNQFSTYWGNMAWTGNPSSDLNEIYPDWQKYAREPVKDAWTNLHIASPKASLEKDYMEDVCDFWDTLDLYPAPK